jgi:hypothetical protein
LYRKDGWKQDETRFGTRIGAFLSLTPGWKLMYFFADFFWISPGFGPNSGYWCRDFLTSRKTLISLIFFGYVDPGEETFAWVYLGIWGSSFDLKLKPMCKDLVEFERLLFLWIKFMMEWNDLTIVRSLFMI